MCVTAGISATAMMFAAGAARADDAKPVSTAPTSPAAAVASAGSASFTTADELLNALHGTGRDIRALSADIRYTKKFAAIEGDESQVRIGSLWFRSQPIAPAVAGANNAESKPDRVFRVDFTTLIVDDKLRDEPQTFIFDGEWLVERQPTQRLQWKRRVVAPGQKIDPLAIGEGPFPMPIGQSREKILERFTAELLAPADGWPGAQAAPVPSASPSVDKIAETTKAAGATTGAPTDVPTNAAAATPPSLAPEWLLRTYQLKLTPKPGTDEARKFESVRLWYDRATLLPRMALTDDGDGAFSEVLLTNVRTNDAADKTGPGAGVFDITLPSGWDEKVDEYADRSDP